MFMFDQPVKDFNCHMLAFVYNKSSFIVDY